MQETDLTPTATIADVARYALGVRAVAVLWSS